MYFAACRLTQERAIQYVRYCIAISTTRYIRYTTFVTFYESIHLLSTVGICFLFQRLGAIITQPLIHPLSTVGVLLPVSTSRCLCYTTFVAVCESIRALRAFGTSFQCQPLGTFVAQPLLQFVRPSICSVRLASASCFKLYCRYLFYTTFVIICEAMRPLGTFGTCFLFQPLDAFVTQPLL